MRLFSCDVTIVLFAVRIDLMREQLSEPYISGFDLRLFTINFISSPGPCDRAWRIDDFNSAAEFQQCDLHDETMRK